MIDPVEKSLVAKITNTTAPGLCTKSNNKVSRLVQSTAFNSSYSLVLMQDAFGLNAVGFFAFSY